MLLMYLDWDYLKYKFKVVYPHLFAVFLVKGWYLTLSINIMEKMIVRKIYEKIYWNEKFLCINS